MNTRVQLNRRNQLLFLPVLSLVVGLFTPHFSQAGCVLGGDDKIEFFISPETGSYGNFSGITDLVPSSVTRCKEDTSRYLMLTLGVARAGINSNLRDVFIFDNYTPESCQLKNSISISGITGQRQKEHVSQQYNLLRTCMMLKVDDLNRSPIVFRQNQEHCQITNSPDGGVYLNGDMCFLKITSRSQFAVLPVLKPECRNPEYLKKLGIMPQDLEASLDVLVAGDDTGNSMQLSQIGSRPIHLNIVPPHEMLPLSEAVGPEIPRFVTDYNVDVDWGKVHIRSGTKTQINLSVLASNLSEKICNEETCVRNSNYIQPVFGQVEIFELKKNNKASLIEEWWDGGFAPANWQGFVSGMGFATEPDFFQKGKRYRIQLTYQNPSDDYSIFLSGLNQILINLSLVNNGVIGIDSIPALGTLKQLGVIPQFMGTSVLKGDDQTVDLSQTIKGLSGIISSRIWPTYYEQACDEGKTSCQKITNKKFYQRLTMDFTAGEISSFTGDLILENITMQKESKVFKSYQMSKATLPEISCGGGQ